MNASTRPPSLRASTIFLAGLALSIGWGIRGQFGHEIGAMLPGALAAIVICLLSGRDDWRRRVAFFAFFGAIGWGFGGSMSYMQVLGYTHSGHAPTQWYGFAAFFIIGFLWASLGGAGMALPAVLDRDRLTRLVIPIIWVFVAWWAADRVLLYGVNLGLIQWPSVNELLVRKFDPDGWRMQGFFSWFDTDWRQAMVALLALFCYDLWSRRLAGLHWLVLFGAGGAALGYGIQHALNAAGLTDYLVLSLTWYKGDVSDAAPVFTGYLRNNWPPLFEVFPQHVGWFLGLMAGWACFLQSLAVSPKTAQGCPSIW